MIIEVCILCKNEYISISKTIKKIRKELKKIKIKFFIMDGKSTDGSTKFYKKNKIKYYTQKKEGRGAAIIEAFNRTKSDALIFFSPDGNENIMDIKKIVYYLNQGNDLVIGSRMIKGARNEEDDKILKFRKWANNIFNFLANLFFNNKKYISDSINGFRGLRKEKFFKLKCDENYYAIEYQMTIRSMKKAYTIKEFATIENNRIAGVSQASSIPTGLTFVRLLLKEIFIGKMFIKNE